jgi:hypothetical protein
VLENAPEQATNGGATAVPVVAAQVDSERVVSESAETAETALAAKHARAEAERASIQARTALQAEIARTAAAAAAAELRSERYLVSTSNLEIDLVQGRKGFGLLLDDNLTVTGAIEGSSAAIAQVPLNSRVLEVAGVAVQSKHDIVQVVTGEAGSRSRIAQASRPSSLQFVLRQPEPVDTSEKSSDGDRVDQRQTAAVPEQLASVQMRNARAETLLAALPAYTNTTPDDFSITFTQHGALGLNLTPCSIGSGVMILAVRRDTQAAMHPELQMGLVVKALQGKSVETLSHQDVTDAIAGVVSRPLAVVFAHERAHAQSSPKSHLDPKKEPELETEVESQKSDLENGVGTDADASTGSEAGSSSESGSESGSDSDSTESEAEAEQELQLEELVRPDKPTKPDTPEPELTPELGYDTSTSTAVDAEARSDSDSGSSSGSESEPQSEPESSAASVTADKETEASAYAAQPAAAAVRYRAVAKGVVRDHADKASAKCGELAIGDEIVVQASETVDGTVRVQFDRGWASVAAASGKVLLEIVEDEVTGDSEADTGSEPASAADVGADIEKGAGVLAQEDSLATERSDEDVDLEAMAAELDDSAAGTASASDAEAESDSVGPKSSD